MPRSEGIATQNYQVNQSLDEALAGTNAPIRGDCDSNIRVNVLLTTTAGTNAPIRGDCDSSALDSSSFAPDGAGTNAPIRGDCDMT